MTYDENKFAEGPTVNNDADNRNGIASTAKVGMVGIVATVKI